MALRRRFLAMTAGAVTAGTVLPMEARARSIFATCESTHPDAELLQIEQEAIPLLALYDAHRREFFALAAESPDLERVAATIPETYQFAGQKRRRRRTPSRIPSWVWKALVVVVLAYAVVRAWQAWA